MGEARCVTQFMYHAAFAYSVHAKRTEPKGAFEHRAIKELIIKTIFTASKGMDCLADAFEDGETHLFNPVPLETIALAATAVLSDIMVRYSFRILTLYTLDLLCSYRMEGWSAFPCSFSR